MGLINEVYVERVVTPRGYVLAEAESRILDGLDRKMGGRLSQITMEEGGEVPEESMVVTFRIKTLGRWRLGKGEIVEQHPLTKRKPGFSI